MSNPQQYSLITDFLQVFVNPVIYTLSKNLDTDICTNIKFEIVSASEVKNTESLKENKAIYKLDYATGSRQGCMIILIPEELIADISDILTGGSGEDAYKGSLSEIETNSTLKVLEKITKILEDGFKKQYEHDLAFSTNPQLILKEMPEYQINSETLTFDLAINSILNLKEEKAYNIQIILSLNVIEELMDDLGFSASSTPLIQNRSNSLDVDRLSDVKINITAELGRTRVPIKYALELVKGSLVELDTLNNSDIKVFANGVEFAYAQVVAVEDNFGLKITKIISPEERLENI
ncbi:MAG: FliM/FliN family flagellar motor switch protein [Candidatus Gastranaerophilales bacterium]|nr:FliM/FliN family flagellar motor switch protein [Candidatus Gastranaerophilales bacterium]